MAGGAVAGTPGDAAGMRIGRERSTARPSSFDAFAGVCAIAAGVLSLGYSAAFLVAVRTASPAAVLIDAVALLVGGLLGTAVFVAVYGHIRTVDEGFALWGLLLGTVSGLGSAVHGAYDLANVINPPAVGAGDFPNPVDPRGLLTFGVAALALAVVAALIVRTRSFPRGLGHLGLVTAGLMLVVYLGRLILLDPTNPVLLGAAALTGFVAYPALFIWIGLALRRPAAR